MVVATQYTPPTETRNARCNISCDTIRPRGRKALARATARPVAPPTGMNGLVPSQPQFCCAAKANTSAGTAARATVMAAAIANADPDANTGTTSAERACWADVEARTYCSTHRKQARM